jgi:hypothetical protein
MQPLYPWQLRNKYIIKNYSLMLSWYDSGNKEAADG